MSSFRLGVAFDKLRFRALKRYLLKNSSSIWTEIRSLILPLMQTKNGLLGYLSLYVRIRRVALSADDYGSPWQSPVRCRFRFYELLSGVRKRIVLPLFATGRNLQRWYSTNDPRPNEFPGGLILRILFPAGVRLLEGILKYVNSCTSVVDEPTGVLGL
jgi:hypothetical protein